jgi:lysozyme family protein
LGVKVDGVFGTISRTALAAVWDHSPAKLLQEYNSYRLAYLAGLNRPADERGWAKRCDIMLCIAIQASGGLPPIAVT